MVVLADFAVADMMLRLRCFLEMRRVDRGSPPLEKEELVNV